MGYLRKLVGRLPIMLIGIGGVLITGSYRGHEAAGGTSPTIGIALVALGIIVWAGLKRAGSATGAN